MVTSIIGKIFLEAYNARYTTSYSADQFFLEIFYPLFFDSSKYLYWVQNSPFVQMKKGQKVETLTSNERKEKLNNFIEKINSGNVDASIAIGYPASEEKEYATTSGQISNLFFPTSKEDVYYSWFGSALGVGVQGGISIFFYNVNILLDVYEGWKLYRKAIDSIEKLPGNKIMTWNGQWLAHRYSRFFNEVDNMSGFNPYTIKNDEFSIDTVSWTRILIGIAQKCPNKQMMGYIYSYGQTNTTIGFIPFDLSQIASPVKLYQRFFGMESGHKAEKLWGTALGFVKACQQGVIGLRAMEPKGLRDYIEKGKMPKLSNKEEQIISFNVYQSWIMAMLNNQDLWDKAQEFASELYKYSSSGNRAKTVNANKVKTVLEVNNKMNFMKSMVDIIGDVENMEKMKEMASIVNTMPSDNVPYFLTLIRFHYATFTNTKKK